MALTLPETQLDECVRIKDHEPTEARHVLTLTSTARLLDRGSTVHWPETERRVRPRQTAHRKMEYWEVEADGNRSLAYTVAKRLLDIIGATVILVLASPIMLVSYFVLSVTTRGNPIFRQQRVGECGRLFTLLKFRTMLMNAELLQSQVKNEHSDGPIFKNRCDPRITRLGAILRKLSIDELPQLFNVLAGDMSLVGPRPPLESEVKKYENWQLRRLSVKPGLTCLWQVSGRSQIGFTQWVRMDLWYIDRQSLLLDLALLAKTPGSVLACRGSY